MSAWKVPLADLVVTEDDLATVADVYRSGWLSLGPRTSELEEALAAYVGSAHAVALSSGTAALHLMCLAAGIGPGDEVIVPSMTFVATVNAVLYTGARPVFADICSTTEPWLDVESVQDAITSRTRAVMAMSYGGHCGEIAALEDVCEQRDLLLLHDGAHALGSRLHGRQLGTFGAACAFSFFSNKNLAVGEGGAAVTDDADLASRLRLLRSHGMTSLSWDRYEGHATGYDVTALGFNYRIDEPRAALAAQRLRRLDDDNARRVALVARDRARFGELGVELPLGPREGLRSAHHLFCIVLDAHVDRHGLRDALAQRGVQTSMHYPPVHQFSIYADQRARLPVTEKYAASTVTLPLFAHMSQAQQDLVVDSVATVLGLGDLARVAESQSESSRERDW
jgi:dTDP-4-amino-4,6-dideoxygalactose transaminase